MSLLQLLHSFQVNTTLFKSACRFAASTAVQRVGPEYDQAFHELSDSIPLSSMTVLPKESAMGILGLMQSDLFQTFGLMYQQQIGVLVDRADITHGCAGASLSESEEAISASSQVLAFIEALFTLHATRQVPLIAAGYSPNLKLWLAMLLQSCSWFRSSIANMYCGRLKVSHG